MINSVLVWLQKTRHIYSRFGKHALSVHSLVLTLVWGLFVASLWLLPSSSLRSTGLRIPFIGLILLAAGVLLFTTAYRQIGSGGFNNANFFGGPTKQLNGIYRYCNDPMYVSYSLLLLSGAFMTGIVTYVLLSVIAAIGLLGFESRAESTDQH